MIYGKKRTHIRTFTVSLSWKEIRFLVARMHAVVAPGYRATINVEPCISLLRTIMFWTKMGILWLFSFVFIKTENRKELPAHTSTEYCTNWFQRVSTFLLKVVRLHLTFTQRSVLQFCKYMQFSDAINIFWRKNSLTKADFPWLIQNCSFSLTFHKIPWLFPDLEKI